MATFSVTTNSNFQDAAFSTRAGNDTYNVSAGARLTIDTDTRYCTNATATTGNLGNVTINSSTGGELYVDGTGVRLIPYNTGTGNVPAIGTTITQGGVTSYLLGVWSALNVAPTAAAAAMPASGYIKVKNKAGGSYAAGALTGIGATATGADVVGWIEVVGVEAATMTVPRLGRVTMRGAWFAVGSTSGSSATTYQLPASLANTYYPGVWIETTAGSGSYEFWPSAGSLVAASSTATDAVRGKVCWISSQGLLRLGSDGTNTVGNLPGAGRAIRVPNIVTINVTSAAMSTNAVPNATLATRYDFTTTGGGAIDLDVANLAWFPSFAQAYSVALTNVGVLEQILMSEIASPMTWSDVGVGQTAAQTQYALSMSVCLAGGTFTRLTLTRSALATSGTYVYAMTDCSGFSFVDHVVRALVYRAHATTGTILLTRVSSCSWTTVTLGAGRVVATTCSFLTFTTVTYYDHPGGTTLTTFSHYAFDLSVVCTDIKVDGLSFGGLTNVQPYLGILSIGAAGCARIKLRNIGTRASPLSLGSANASAYVLVIAAAAAALDVRVQRCWVTLTRTGLWSVDNSSKGFIFEASGGDNADAPVVSVLNGKVKGVRCAITLTAQTAVYGTHWWDTFTSDTAGRIGFFCNEATAETAVEVEVTAGSPAFTSAGGLYMPAIGDQVVFTMSYFALGHTAFQNSAAVMAGGTIGNYTLEFQADVLNGGGWSSWSTLNGTNLSALTLDPAKGVKLKIRITTSATNSAAITSLYMLTNSTLAAQGDNLYPLDTYTLTVAGLQSPSEVRVFDAADPTTEIGGQEDVTTGSFELDVDPVTYPSVHVSVLALGYQNVRYKDVDITGGDVALLVQQQIDRQYENP